MTARLLDGRALGRRVEETLAKDVAALRARLGRAPRLAAVLVGEDAASKVYLKRKSEAAQRVGIESSLQTLPANSTQAQVAAALDRLAADPAVDGILLQLPLPPGLDADRLMVRIPPSKDVDGFHPTNMGELSLGRDGLAPCTPRGILEILDDAKVALHGAEVCIVNHSHVVGRPLAMMLLHRNATVTVCHKFTKDLAAHTRRADVLITATGVAGLIGADHVKPGATVIDVGIARAKDGGITGDVRFEEVSAVAGQITPVPGGVGPMTVAMLMRNVVWAARKRLDASG
jgi:methylenetetrahydrofolate dehydrogenase (NADP+)/methenyltetrahydrofolate cyclohydrolase